MCFAAAAVIGLPTYFLTRDLLGQSFSAIIMVTLMVPFFLLAVYEKDGMPLEKIIHNIILVRFVLPAERPYITHHRKDGSNPKQEEVVRGKQRNP